MHKSIISFQHCLYFQLKMSTALQTTLPCRQSNGLSRSLLELMCSLHLWSHFISCSFWKNRSSAYKSILYQTDSREPIGPPANRRTVYFAGFERTLYIWEIQYCRCMQYKDSIGVYIILFLRKCIKSFWDIHCLKGGLSNALVLFGSNNWKNNLNA